MIDIYVDADACPVKEEIYQVAARHGVRVLLVANQKMHVPPGAWVEMVVVGQGADVADDWIAEHVVRSDVVVTADIPLAARCLERGARVLSGDGRPFDADMIGSALATRELKSQLRDMGAVSGGPPPLSDRARSRFLSGLDTAVQVSLREVGS